ncbi:glycosyltransferase family 2 protein [Microbulbifer yueqingensis]|uniref:Glycosyltransferase, GT2 family n=1 Tax=Microbulbifer yueqingensis TaxID=658219 RepID=A0A1G9A9J3_9GAMM|nr:glycosyltransferase family 2 protein [Microbulbifer yueqingensis]SDK24036.1 Glycosyltransferase, GT2 family [Microbulbifer yueqingensis]
MSATDQFSAEGKPDPSDDEFSAMESGSRKQFPCAHCEKVEAELKEANLRLEWIYSSKSWLLTRPLRCAARLARRAQHYVRYGLQAAKRGIIHGLYMVARAKWLPAKLKYRLLGIFRWLTSRVFQVHSNNSNRQMMRHLARDRNSALFDIEFDDCMEDMPEIEITAVTFNNKKWLKGFFQSLCAQNYPLKKITLHFVDNASSDGTPEEIEDLTLEFGDKFKAVHLYNRPNLGFGAGHDFAIRKCVADYVLVSNVDLVFEEDSITRAVSFAAADKAKTASWEFRQKPYEHPKYFDPVTLETSWSSHACILIQREAYLDVGGYEPKIFMYGEDVELSYRFRDAGYHVKYVPQAVVWHHTYEHAHQVKPVQFMGSTLANAYIRLRYGSVKDIIAILALYGSLITIVRGVPGGRRMLFKNLLKIVVNAPYFLLTRKKSTLRFPFRAWDYEMQRDGAFFELRPPVEKPPLVSVITRTYPGREKWLRECIASVLNQTYPNLELVVVEDGGETHRDFIQKVSERLPEGKQVIYSGQPKKGRSFNGNAGLDIASGQYFTFLDDDDLFFPDHVETLMAELLHESKVVGVYGLSWEVETSTNAELKGSSHYLEETHSTPAIFRQEFSVNTLRHHNFIPIQAVIFKRDLYDQFGGFDIEMDALEDWDLWVRYTSDSPFKYVEKTTSLFRTPYDRNERMRRHETLHASYKRAVDKQKKFFASRDSVHEQS